MFFYREISPAPVVPAIPEIVADGLVLNLDAQNSSSYPGSGLTWYDLSNVDNDATLNNNVTFTNNAFNQKFFNFNGSNSVITIPETSSYNSNALTIELWLRTANLSQNGFFLEKGNVNTQYSFFQESTSIVWRLNGTVGRSDLRVDSSVLSGTDNFVQVVATYSPGNRKIYVNANQVASDSYNSAIITNPNGISIGAFGGYNGSRGYFYTGSIAIARIYNKQLTTEEILQNYSASIGTYVKTFVSINTDSTTFTTPDIAEGFEYTDGWPGSVDPNSYVSGTTTFTTPDIAEGFEPGSNWPGVDQYALILTSSVNTVSFGNVFTDTTSTSTINISAGGIGQKETITLTDDSNQFSFSPASFKLTGGGSSVPVTISFTPTSVGVKTANLSVSASNGSIISVPLDGVGQVPLVFTSSLASIYFGNGYINETSTSMFNVSANGYGQVEAITLSDNSSQFGFSPSSFFLTGGGAPVTVTASFTPTSTGVKMSTLSLSGAGGNVLALSLDGVGLLQTNQIILTGSGFVGEHYGTAVALNYNGTIAAVSAPGQEGNFYAQVGSGFVHILTSGSAGWTKNAQVVGEPGVYGNKILNFGSRIAINDAGTRIFVTSPSDTLNPTGFSEYNGIVYMFDSGSGNDWQQSRMLVGEYAKHSTDHFAGDLVISSDGNIAVIGAYRDEIPYVSNTNSGLVYVYADLDNASGSYIEQSFIISGSGALYEHFGVSVAMNGDGTYIVVGQGTEQSDTRSTYIYKYNGYAWQKIDRIFNSDADKIGAVTINNSGTRIAIMEYELQVDPIYNEQYFGIVQVYNSSSNGWTKTASLTGSLATPIDEFGTSISMNDDGDCIVVGATRDQPPSGNSAGLSYVFKSSSNGWVETNILSGAYAANQLDKFGASVSISGDGARVIIGAPNDQSEGLEGLSGVAYLFELDS